MYVLSQSVMMARVTVLLYKCFYLPTHKLSISHCSTDGESFGQPGQWFTGTHLSIYIYVHCNKIWWYYIAYLRIVLTDTHYSTGLLVLHSRNTFHTFFILYVGIPKIKMMHERQSCYTLLHGEIWTRGNLILCSDEFRYCIVTC